MKRKIKGVIIVLCFWIFLTEKIAIDSLFIGMGVSFLVLGSNRMFKSTSEIKGRPMKAYLYMLKYLLILIKEVIIANFQVAFIIIRPKLDVSPKTITYKTQLQTDLLRTILSNSITLTPGTLTVSLDGDLLKIHCLKDTYVMGILEAELEKILLKIEGCR